ncbi:hypothetical protein PRIPAC_70793 [Pristionchus pacificus]|uniref:Uncharacterized protein n=1 Tax=Pristionchus pacificus TaxID=54126 RepID=A0A2A6C1B6_PRIPA|nr:hypothetical protein PRIPAC_70793 [Pristionchus pacificus]|eukprot:PDM71965.1 hypothetical protein PRIPAC_38372 [Pristionchus pacificus]
MSSHEGALDLDESLIRSSSGAKSSSDEGPFLGSEWNEEKVEDSGDNGRKHVFNRGRETGIISLYTAGMRA